MDLGSKKLGLGLVSEAFGINSRDEDDMVKRSRRQEGDGDGIAVSRWKGRVGVLGSTAVRTPDSGTRLIGVELDKLTLAMRWRNMEDSKPPRLFDGAPLHEQQDILSSSLVSPTERLFPHQNQDQDHRPPRLLTHVYSNVLELIVMLRTQLDKLSPASPCAGQLQGPTDAGA
ncbi:hypothetical protein G7046_g8425 [Stylonectria norvegica]|nr:hypothetical protein G7046_g8425 [Stylonectria norvegica]